MSPINKDEINELVKQKEYSKVEELIKLYLQDEPNNIKLLSFLGKILFWQDKDEEAIGIFLDVENLDVNNFNDNYFLGMAYEWNKNFDEAIERYTRAIEKGEGSTFINYRIGLVFKNYEYKNKDEKKAKLFMRLATEGENPIEEAFYELAGLEGPNRAVYILKNGLKKFPKSIGFYERIARFNLNRLNNPEGTIQTFNDAIEQGIVSNDLLFLTILAYRKVNNFSKALETLSKMVINENDTYKQIQLLKGVIQIENDNWEEAKNTLIGLINEDYTNELNNLTHFILMAYYLKNGFVKEAEDLLIEVPDNFDIETPFLLIYPYGEIEIKNYYIEAINQIIEKSLNNSMVKKARLFRSKIVYQINMFEENPSSKENQLAVWKRIRDDAIDVEKDYDRDINLKKIIGYAFLAQKNWLKAAHYFIIAQLRSDENEYLKLPLEEIYQNKERNLKFLKSLGKYIENRFYEEKFCIYILNQIVTFLFEKHEFNLIIEITNKISDKNLYTSSVLFHIAYAYSEKDDYINGKKYYLMRLKKSEDAGALNNLGVLYENENQLEEAKKLFQKSADIGNQIAIKNLSRVEKSLKQIEEETMAFNKAKMLFGQEVEEAKKITIALYEKHDDDGLIFCNLRNISEITGVNQLTIKKYIDDFKKKKYFIEIKNSSLPIEGIALKLNPSLVPIIEDELRKLTEKEVIGNLAESLSSSNLKQLYGYDQELINKLNVLSSPEMVVMLQRDIRELIYSLVTGSYKSVLILGGSIIEAILLDRLSVDESRATLVLEQLLKKEGKSITSKDRGLEFWSLERLLDVAYEEKIISQNLYYWGNGLRGYRNLVHPGVEKRKQIKITKGNADIGWNVVKNLIDEII